ncbi:hypothetical protein EYC84_010861 [Monilinia fructicola]|uniref:non-specific serine/threonine protein kinase n=1 Tax=Monilinia fructicola TaxID=38448 RepID=A0A5M9JB68_MONFR|nr:hypothetical protein EYC84_010861 [Monilinia fructicola]
MTNPNLPEMTTLPPGWIGRFDDNDRVYFVGPGGKSTYDHPKYGVIPKPWQLKVDRSVPKPCEYYYNTQTKTKTKENPRFNEDVLGSSLLKVSRVVRESATVTKNSQDEIKNKRRTHIKNIDVRQHYEIVHTIDKGEGGIGGMNGGVHVVRHRGIMTGLYVEKRFKKDALRHRQDGKPGFGTVEILITHRVIHGGLAAFIEGFIAPDMIHPTSASLYLEFCDLGSLNDLINCFAQRIHTNEAAYVPERFVWHAFCGLCDALAYLWGGKSFLSDKMVGGAVPKKGWKPILHRDMKPDNILIRSRNNLSSQKYPYLVISDFGLATDDPTEIAQRGGGMAGSRYYFAPEILWPSVPRDPRLLDFFPPGQSHTFESDLYSLGVCIHNLCKPTNEKVDGTFWMGAWSHFNLQTYRKSDTNWPSLTISRNEVLDIGSFYSLHLRRVIQKATHWKLSQRGTAHQLAPKLVDIATSAGYGEEEFGENERLPAWAIKVHDYNTR